MLGHVRKNDRTRDRLWRAAQRGEVDPYKALVGSIVLLAMEDARRGDRMAAEDLRALGVDPALQPQPV